MKELMAWLSSGGILLVLAIIGAAVFIFFRNSRIKIVRYQEAIILPYEKRRDILVKQVICSIMNICAVRMRDISQVTSELVSDIKQINLDEVVKSEKYELLMRLFERHHNNDKLISNEIARANKLIEQSFGDEFVEIFDPVEYRESADGMISELEKAAEDLQRVFNGEVGRCSREIPLISHQPEEEEHNLRVVGADR